MNDDFKEQSFIQEDLELTEKSRVLEVVEDNLPTEIDNVQAQSVIESLLFASHTPVSIKQIAGVFHGSNIDSDKVKQILELLQTDFAGGDRGVELVEVGGGFQLRTKVDNMPWIKRMVKTRSFKLSGPALEVLSIVAYKQPVVKAEVDQIRGVESGHLVRALMEKNLIKFAGKSEQPGKPMLYGTTREFLELFGLRNIRELPTLSEIEELIPEGIGENKDIIGLEDETLGTLSEKIGLPMGKSYSDSESELLTITGELSEISTTTEFFEQEKRRERERREAEKAQDLRERKIVGETLSEEEEKWLLRFEQKMQAIATPTSTDNEA
ncbi:MAG: SMC-Scp complex subunit ScpB [Oligoflexia bacterium]|nr:SMC-Scp complex subunit ScpB [Oligoflexia bacterium]